MLDRGWNVVLCAALICAACDDDDNGSSDNVELSVATYNLGLIDSVGFVPQRAPLAIEAATALDADLLCVQEVWEQGHWDALVDAQDDRRPHHLRLPPDPGAQGMCSPDEFNPLQVCAEAACSEATPDNLVPCVTENCAAEVSELQPGCTTCLLSNAASGNFEAIRGACVGAPNGDEAGRAYVQGGSYGIGLLSAQPFAETDELLLDASTVRRAILYAHLEGLDVHVFCTHLTAIQRGLRYDGSYGSWEGENAAHVEALIDFVNEKAGAGERVIVMGDLNTGPEGEGLSPAVPENYARLPSAGYENAFLSGPDAACTFCADNVLVTSDEEGAADGAIDHILTRNAESVSVERVLDSTVEVEIPAQGDMPAMARELPLSDHYGLRAVVRF